MPKIHPFIFMSHMAYYMILNWGNFASLRTIVNVTEKKGILNIWWEGTRGAAKYLTMQGKLPTANNYMTQKVNDSTGAEKPY